MGKSKMSVQRVLILIYAILFSACASTQIALHTTPSNARVYAKSLGRGKLEYKGETPLFLKGEDLEKEFGGSGPLYLEFRKDGYRTTTTLVTELSYVDLNVTMEMTPESGLEDPSVMNTLIDSMFECQRLVKVKRYDEAIYKLREMKRIAPQLSAIYELEGGIYYLQQKYQDALDAYRISVRYNPRNSEALRMRNLIEDTFGLGRRTPSASEVLPTTTPTPAPEEGK